MPNSDFVHLHVHGQHSLLDGLTRAEDAVATALADGQPGIAQTDHGNLAGIYKMARAAKAAGMPFWPGQEIYMSIGSRFEKNHVLVPREDDFDGSGGAEAGQKKKIYEHLTVLAGNRLGWRNLMALSNDMHDTFYMKPRADYDLLGKYSEGLTVGTGCLGGPVAGQLLIGNPEQAEANLRRLVDIFGPRVFVEVMDHGIPAERKIVSGLVELARKYGLLTVATNDAHYARATDAAHHDAWLCVAQSKGSKNVRVSDPDRWRFNGSGYHLRTAAEMHALFDDQPGTQHSVRNSLKVVEDFESDIVIGSFADHHRLPVYPVPVGHTLDTYFRARCLDGLHQRYGADLSAEVRDRANLEKRVIRQFGVQSYYLTIADVVAAERAAGGLVGAGRGSGPGSILAYALGITQLDPLRFGLLFERFLNPDRAALPDFDTDFQASRRDLIVLRTADDYGHDKVSRIGTYGQSWAKQGLKQMGRVLGMEALSVKLADAVPGGDPKKFRLSYLMDPSVAEGAELRSLVASVGDDAQRLVDAALSIEGSASNETVHPCGVVISDEPLPGLLPLRRVSHAEGEWMPATEWDASEVEAAQFVKFDFLALKDLDVCATALELIERTTGDVVDFYALDADADDERSRRTKEMLAAGRTAGVFQVAGRGITELTRDIRPETASDLAAILALYRPGPMGAGQDAQFARRRRGGEPVDYGVFTDSPAEAEVLRAVLDETMGSLCYQEELMVLGREVSDFTSGQMSQLQKAFSKKKQEMMDALKEPFIVKGMAAVRGDGTPKVAFQRSTLEKLWRAFEASGSYLFNKCLTGDTVLSTGRGTGSQAETVTVADLYRRLHGADGTPVGACRFCGERPRAPQRPDGKCARCRSWQATFDGRRGFNVLAWDKASDRIKPSRVADVHFNGVKPVVRVSLADGRTVRATVNHRLLTNRGWRVVGELKPGVLLAVDGGDAAVAYTAVMSILPDGVEPTYDVEMAEGTDHNFLANGIVSHNSHSYAYAQLTWQTAYLKANWPAHYGAALLANTTKDEKRQQVLADLLAEGVTVRPPDINVSERTTGVDGDAVVLGLGEIKGVGKVADAIVAARAEGGPFTSLADLMDRASVNSLVAVALAEAGALDAFGPRLGQVMCARVARVPGMEVPACEWGVQERSTRQRLRLGVLVGEHPLRELREAIKRSGSLAEMKMSEAEVGRNLRPIANDFGYAAPDGDINVLQVHALPHVDGSRVHAIGVVASVEERMGRGRRLMLVLDSALGSVEAIMWPDQYAAHRLTYGVPRVGQVLGVTGKIRLRTVVHDNPTDPEGDGAAAESVISLYLDRLWPLEDLHDPDSGLRVVTSTLTPAALPAAADVAVPEPAPKRARKAKPKPEPALDGDVVVKVEAGQGNDGRLQRWCNEVPGVEASYEAVRTVRAWARSAQVGDEMVAAEGPGWRLIVRAVEQAGSSQPGCAPWRRAFGATQDVASDVA